jgi:hypothetical protein
MPLAVLDTSIKTGTFSDSCTLIRIAQAAFEVLCIALYYISHIFWTFYQDITSGYLRFISKVDQ